ncbi:MAG TPA: AarF/UbiB family protein [Thermoanaerobaculia bacterium]|nr:AarF/UbiB family protein [Thermoanaerobaculia bacterium]
MRTAQERSASPEAAARRKEIERALAAAGLLPGLHSVPPATAPLDPEAGFGARLRMALEQLGPVFSSFGLYLACRPDLLPAGDCLELSGLPDLAKPMPVEAVLAAVESELRREPREAFAGFEEAPCESRLLFQAHRARLPGGQPVIVRILRAGLDERLALDLPLLPRLGPAFAEGFPLEETVADFRAFLEQELDLLAQAVALDRVAAETENVGPLRAPGVCRELATPKMLVLQDLGGSGLAERGEDVELARRLCLLWLRQALLGPAFPAEPWGTNVAVLAGERIAFTGGVLAEPPPAVQANLWGYLIAASNQDVDEVCTWLLRESTLEGPPWAEEQLRLRLRQAVPFRDGSWSRSGEGLAEHLFLHWRFARECGFRPGAHLLAFFRGLTALTFETRRLAPGRDVLLRALEDVRLLAGMQQLGEMMNFDRLRENFERYAALAVQLPQKLDEVLTLAAEGDLRRPTRPAARPPERRRGSSLVWVSLLLALAAVVLLARQVDGVWGERVGALLFLMVGALLLRFAGRT